MEIFELLFCTSCTAHGAATHFFSDDPCLSFFGMYVFLFHATCFVRDVIMKCQTGVNIAKSVSDNRVTSAGAASYQNYRGGANRDLMWGYLTSQCTAVHPPKFLWADTTPGPTVIPWIVMYTVNK